jgi:hypothetical protein
MSVPNDAFWAMENPHHRTMWGEGAFAELRSLLPEWHTVAAQVQLNGSAIALDGEGQAPTHFLATWGGDALAPVRDVVATDLDEQRDWVRRREADLAYFKAVAAERDELYAEVRRLSDQLADYRRYIHDLEGRLGLPLSGEPPQLAPGDGT